MASPARPMDPEYRNALIASINATASQARLVLASMLVVAVSLAATVIGTTDEAILYDSADVLPALGVRLPVLTMYALAPPVFVFLHVTALLKLDLLGERVKLLDQLPGPERRRALHLLDGFPLLRLLAGGGSLANALLLRLVAWLSIVLVPIMLLAATQISFVRYQHDWLGWTHCAALVADMAMLSWFHWRLYPRTLKSWNGWRTPRIIAVSANVVAGAVVTVFVVAYAWPPGSTADSGQVRMIESGRSAPSSMLLSLANGLDVWLCPALQWGCRYLRLDNRTLLRDGAAAGAAWIELVGLDDRHRDAALAAALGIDLRGRNLRFADFRGSSLPHAMLTRTDLSQARLDHAMLDKVRAEEATLTGASLREATLTGALLNMATLTGARLAWATLTGASLDLATLTGASLDRATLTGASLDGATLTGASLDLATLTGASLDRATLTGASLDRATLTGASLREATLTGAWLFRLDLRSAAGRTRDCTGVVAWQVSTDGWPQDGPDGHAAFRRWIAAHPDLPDHRRKAVLEQLGEKPRKTAAYCNENGDAESLVTLQQVRPLPAATAEVLRKAACHDKDAAHGIVRNITTVTSDVSLKEGNRILEAAEAAATSLLSDHEACPGLAALPDRELDRLRSSKDWLDRPRPPPPSEDAPEPPPE